MTQYVKHGLNAIQYAIKIGSVKILDFLVSNGAETQLIEQNRTSNVLLKYLATTESTKIVPEIVEYLLNHIDFKTKDENGDSICHWLASLGFSDLIRKLPEDALVVKNYQGWNPLHFSVESSSFETCKVLIELAHVLLEMKCDQNKE